MKTRLTSLLLSVLPGLVFVGLAFYTWREYRTAQVVVEWSTASELDTVGFNIYRSDTSTDPGLQVNAELIPASDDAQTGGDYSYTDEDIEPGQVYYYFLEDVSANGTISRHGPLEVKAKANEMMVWMLILALAVVALFEVAVMLWRRRKFGKWGDEQNLEP